MDKGSRRAVLGAFGLLATGAVLLGSGFLCAGPQPASSQTLPPAVAAPANSQNAAPPAAAGADTNRSPEARIAALQQELQKDMHNSAAWAELGSLYLQLRRFPVAADAYAAALELEPTNGAYRNTLANALLFSGMTRMALREYQKIVRQEPENAGAHMNLAVALSHSTPADFEGAVAEWQEVVRLAPGEPIAAKAQEYLAAYRKP